MKEFWIKIKVIEAVPVDSWLHCLCEDEDVVDAVMNGAVEALPDELKNPDGSSKHTFMGRP